MSDGRLGGREAEGGPRVWKRKESRVRALPPELLNPEGVGVETRPNKISEPMPQPP